MGASGISRRGALGAALLAAALLVFGVSIGSAQTADDTYLTSPALLHRALEKLFAAVGRTPKVSRLVVGPDELTVRVQAETHPYETDEWTVGLFRRFFFDRDVVRGPRPAADDGVVAEAENGFFDLKDVALSRLGEVRQAALKRAGLEGPASITSIMVDRSVSLLPTPAFGEVRWTIAITSGRESATIYASAAGDIIGADLSQTHRAQRLNLFTQDDWPIAEAQGQLAALLGDGEVVHVVRLYDSYVFVEADSPADPKQERSYSWDYSGVKRGLMDSPNMLRMGLGDRAAFRISELRLDALPAIKRNAVSALAMPNGRITSVEAQKLTSGVGKPEVRWTVEITDTNNEVGKAVVGIDGAVIDVLLPESRRPKEEFLAPATLVKTLKRLEAKFGADARFTQIMIDDENAAITAEDPLQPGSLADFLMDADSIERQQPMAGAPPDNGLAEGAAFTLAELAPLTAERLGDFAARTLARMNLDGAAIERVTIWRHGVMVESRQGKPIVEVRAGKDHGWTGGWVVFELDGTEIDVVTP